MLKIGGFYLTMKGQLVKIFNEFQFADGYPINAAVYIVGLGWTAVRYTPEGKCNSDGNHNIVNAESFTNYANYMQFLVFFDRNTNRWNGRATDPRGQHIVQIGDIEHREQAMKLIQLGCEQKMLTWMREAGYDEESKELVDA